MRAVLDTNVIVSAALTRQGAPASILRAWIDGAFDLIASPLLIAELRRVLAYPKIRRYIDAVEAAALVDLIGRHALLMNDPVNDPPTRSRDPGDNYLIALAKESRAVIVTGDTDLLRLADRIPVTTPAEFVVRLETA